MKKQVKKLVLAKETVRRLGDQDLTPAFGGWGSTAMWTCDNIKYCANEPLTGVSCYC